MKLPWQMADLRFDVLQTSLVVTWYHNQVVSTLTFRPTTPLSYRLSWAQIWKRAFYAAEKSYGWNTAEVSVNGWSVLE
jgi:hypothetical protein